MNDLARLVLPALIPGVLCLYALAFIAGGVYYLEQRVPRIRDQFPERTLLARLTGYVALAIGVLAALSVGGHLLALGTDFRVGTLVAAAAGVAFWVYHLYVALTPVQRFRDVLLVLICATLTWSTYWWIQTA